MLINPTALHVSHILLLSINLTAKECQRGIPKDDQEITLVVFITCCQAD